MTQYVVPINKVAYPQRRLFAGRHGWQNWYRIDKRVAQWSKRHPDAKVLVLTSFKLASEPESESIIHARAMIELGVKEEQIQFEDNVLDTIDQVERLREIMSYKKSEVLVVICDALQYLRVKWLCRDMKFKYEIVWGLPNLQEMFTDPILAVIFPIIDKLGFGKRFSDWSRSRRLKGKV